MIDLWIHSVLIASIRGGIALAIVWAFCQIPRIPAAVQCRAWRGAYAVLLVSFFWTSPVNLAIRKATIVKPIAVEARHIAAPYMVPAGPEPIVEADVAPIPTKAAAPIVPPRPLWPMMLAAGWLFFFAVYLGRLIVGWTKALRLLDGVEVEVPVLVDLCRAMNVRPPIVRLDPSVGGPLLIGLWRPVIVLPEFVRQSADLLPILAHELAHLKRRDLLWNWLPTIAMAVLPFHPMVWIGNRRWRLAVESACDADALSATRASPVAYGRMLVDTATAAQFPRFGVLAVGVVSGSPWLLTRRLNAMRNINSWTRRRMNLVGLLLGITAAVAAVPWRVVAQQPPATQPLAQSTTGRFYNVTVERDGKKLAVSVPDGGTLTLVSNKRGDEPTTKPVPVDHAMSQRFSGQNGRITAATADLVARTTGTLTQVAFHEGQLVKAGDLIFKIDDAAEQTTLAYSEADMREKLVLLDRKKEMFSKGVATDSEVHECESGFRLSESRVSLEKIELGLTRITAPFDGVLLANDLQVGMNATSGQKLATLVQTGQMKVTLALTGNSYEGLKTGMVMDVACGSGDHLPAVVTYISPDIDAGGVRTVRARLIGDTKDLIVGSNCAVTLPETK